MQIQQNIVCIMNLWVVPRALILRLILHLDFVIQNPITLIVLSDSMLLGGIVFKTLNNFLKVNGITLGFFLIRK